MTDLEKSTLVRLDEVLTELKIQAEVNRRLTREMLDLHLELAKLKAEINPNPYNIKT